MGLHDLSGRPLVKQARRLVTLLAVPVLLAGCSLCDNEISQTVGSPSGKLKAVVFNRNCGATTGFNTQVSILAASTTLPDDGGNTLTLKGAVPLKVEWRSDSSLHLSGPGAAETFKKNSAVAGVSIDYGD